MHGPLRNALLQTVRAGVLQADVASQLRKYRCEEGEHSLVLLDAVLREIKSRDALSDEQALALFSYLVVIWPSENNCNRLVPTQSATSTLRSLVSPYRSHRDLSTRFISKSLNLWINLALGFVHTRLIQLQNVLADFFTNAIPIVPSCAYSLLQVVSTDPDEICSDVNPGVTLVLVLSREHAVQIAKAFKGILCDLTVNQFVPFSEKSLQLESTLLLLRLVLFHDDVKAEKSERNHFLIRSPIILDALLHVLIDGWPIIQHGSKAKYHESSSKFRILTFTGLEISLKCLLLVLPQTATLQSLHISKLMEGLRVAFFMYFSQNTAPEYERNQSKVYKSTKNNEQKMFVSENTLRDEFNQPYHYSLRPVVPKKEFNSISASMQSQTCSIPADHHIMRVDVKVNEKHIVIEGIRIWAGESKKTMKPLSWLGAKSFCSERGKYQTTELRMAGAEYVVGMNLNFSSDNDQNICCPCLIGLQLISNMHLYNWLGQPSKANQPERLCGQVGKQFCDELVSATVHIISLPIRKTDDVTEELKTLDLIVGFRARAYRRSTFNVAMGSSVLTQSKSALFHLVIRYLHFMYALFPWECLEFIRNDSKFGEYTSVYLEQMALNTQICSQKFKNARLWEQFSPKEIEEYVDRVSCPVEFDLHCEHTLNETVELETQESMRSKLRLASERAYQARFTVMEEEDIIDDNMATFPMHINVRDHLSSDKICHSEVNPTLELHHDDLYFPKEATSNNRNTNQHTVTAPLNCKYDITENIRDQSSIPNYFGLNRHKRNNAQNGHYSEYEKAIDVMKCEELFLLEEERLRSQERNEKVKESNRVKNEKITEDRHYWLRRMQRQVKEAMQVNDTLHEDNQELRDTVRRQNLSIDDLTRQLASYATCSVVHRARENYVEAIEKRATNSERCCQNLSKQLDECQKSLPKVAARLAQELFERENPHQFCQKCGFVRSDYSEVAGEVNFFRDRNSEKMSDGAEERTAILEAELMDSKEMIVKLKAMLDKSKKSAELVESAASARYSALQMSNNRLEQKMLILLHNNSRRECEERRKRNPSIHASGNYSPLESPMQSDNSPSFEKNVLEGFGQNDLQSKEVSISANSHHRRHSGFQFSLENNEILNNKHSDFQQELESGGDNDIYMADEKVNDGSNTAICSANEAHSNKIRNGVRTQVDSLRLNEKRKGTEHFRRHSQGDTIIAKMEEDENDQKSNDMCRPM